MRFLLTSSRLVPILFAPAGAMLIVHAIDPSSTIAVRLLALAIALFCFELAHMASVDLKNILTVSPSQLLSREENARLIQFYFVVVSTVALEITGFYTALFFLPVGATIIIISQLWFNLLAGIQLEPDNVPPIMSFGAADRKLIIVANGLGITLLLFWPIQAIQTILASGLLTLIVLFLLIKYGLSVIKSGESDEAGI